MPSVIAKKVLTFSLVSVPVGIVSATSEHKVPLHQVHATDGARVRYRKVCSRDGQEVPEEDIERGYELPDGRTLVLTRSDLESLPMADTREIRVLGFLPADRVDPLYYHRGYYLTAGPGAARPYALLCEALARSGRVAIGRTAIRTRDSLVAIGARDRVLSMITLLWPDEVRSPEHLAPEALRLQPEEVDLAGQLIDAFGEGFSPEAEEDEYTAALVRVVEAKAAGLPAPHAPDAAVFETAPVVDLTALLEEAIARAAAEHPKTAAARPAGEKPAARRGTRRPSPG
ncbi:Ku protein [Kitasatospora sp. NPDC090091]|uniref:non-homologous end joining protein Ku n=1 Tax=Kitasatospora sp. NPDC090091 TaxID=3364081 RepID=UPI003805DA3F